MNMENTIDMKEMNEWYKNNILSKVGSVHLENEDYIIGAFPDCESIEFEATELRHALFYFIKNSYEKKTVTFYPLFLRYRNNPKIPYCSIGIIVENGEVQIMNGLGDIEEAVLKNNALLKDKNIQAYMFLTSSLDEIGKQMCMEE